VGWVGSGHRKWTHGNLYVEAESLKNIARVMVEALLHEEK